MNIYRFTDPGSVFFLRLEMQVICHRAIAAAPIPCSSIVEPVHPNSTPDTMNINVLLAAEGADRMLELIEQAPEPTEEMLRLFRDDPA